MKTVKDVSEISRVSIRTLRYYDKIGLLKPTELSDAGYRLYDNKALERLREIMFFKELEIPLEDIKKIMDSPNYDKEQALLTQKNLLEQKRNQLNGIIVPSVWAEVARIASPEMGYYWLPSLPYMLVFLAVGIYLMDALIVYKVTYVEFNWENDDA
jgi:DNA-binding transcriptional MerR regulator